MRNHRSRWRSSVVGCAAMLLSTMSCNSLRSLPTFHEPTGDVGADATTAESDMNGTQADVADDAGADSSCPTTECAPTCPWWAPCKCGGCDTGEWWYAKIRSHRNSFRAYRGALWFDGEIQPYDGEASNGGTESGQPRGVEYDETGFSRANNYVEQMRSDGNVVVGTANSSTKAQRIAIRRVPGHTLEALEGEWFVVGLIDQSSGVERDLARFSGTFELASDGNVVAVAMPQNDLTLTTDHAATVGDLGEIVLTDGTLTWVGQLDDASDFAAFTIEDADNFQAAIVYALRLDPDTPQMANSLLERFYELQHYGFEPMPQNNTFSIVGTIPADGDGEILESDRYRDYPEGENVGITGGTYGFYTAKSTYVMGDFSTGDGRETTFDGYVGVVEEGNAQMALTTTTDFPESVMLWVRKRPE